MRCFVVAGFLLISASRSPSAIAELLVSLNVQVTQRRIQETYATYFIMIFAMV